MSGLLFIPGIEQADLADEATVQAALASALWFPGSPTSICGIEEPGLLFALSASTALNPYPLALFSDDQDGALWRGTLASSVFSDVTGTTPATLGDTVARVNDTSGNGINLSQANSALRPKFGSRPVTGIRNQLTYSEDFSNAVWIKDGTGVASAPVVTPNDALAPDGSMTADRVALRLNGEVGSGWSWIYQNKIVKAGQTGTISIWVKAVAPADVGKIVRLSGVISATPITLTADWQRVSFANTDVSTATHTFGLRLRGLELTADSVDLYVWGGQVEFSASATDYQKVGTTAQDVTEAGVESVTYVQFDLVDDALPSVAFPDGLAGQAFVAGDGGCYVSDVTIAPAATFSVGGTSHNWTGATPGILRAVTGDTGRVLDMAVREGDFTEAELDRLVRKYRALGGKGLLVPGPELIPNGDFTDGLTGWTVAASAPHTITVSGGIVTFSAAADAAPASMSIAPNPAFVSGPYLVELTFEAGSSGVLKVLPFGSTSEINIAVAEGVWRRVSYWASPGASLTLSRTGAAANALNSNISVRRLIPEEEL